MSPTRARSSRRSLEGLLVAALVALAPRAANAGEEPLTRVAYVGDDAELLHALSVSLASWHVDVVPTAEPALGATLPEAAAVADAVCTRAGARAAVWISRSPAGLALWVYDSRTHELVSRPVDDAPPYSGPIAAALALATKTLLKKSLVAPEAERFGASTQPAQPAPPAPPPRVDPPPPRPSVFLEGGGGARFFGISTQPAEARFALGLSFYPRAARPLGLFVDVALGPGTTVVANGVDARVLTVTPALGARLRFEWGRWLALEPGVGLVLGVSTFDGVADGQTVALLRANPGARAAFVLDLRLNERASLGLVNQVDLGFRRQEYTLAGATIAEAGLVTWDVALRLRVGAD
jgi:hypothetical protein